MTISNGEFVPRTGKKGQVIDTFLQAFDVFTPRGEVLSDISITAYALNIQIALVKESIYFIHRLQGDLILVIADDFLR